MIEFQFDAPDAVHYLQKVEDRVLRLAVRHAVNRALRGSRKDADKDFLDRYGVGKNSGRKPGIDEFLESKKLRMADLKREKSALILAESHPESLIHYVLGPRRSQRLKGVPMHRRRKVWVDVARISHHGKSFIQKPATRPGGTQVFSYGNFKGTVRLIKQTLPHAFSVMTRKRLQNEMTRDAEALLEKEFNKRMEKELAKLNREPRTLREQLDGF